MIVGSTMALSVRTVEYFYTRVVDAPGRTYELLAKLASEEINLLAFSAVPFGPNHVELTIFPEQSEALLIVAKRLGWTLTGPQHACLVQGDDRSEEHTSELQSHSFISYAAFCLKKK